MFCTAEGGVNVPLQIWLELQELVVCLGTQVCLSVKKFEEGQWKEATSAEQMALFPVVVLNVWSGRDGSS